MKVKNEYVKIKSGTKEYTLKNYIYDSYLKLFSDCQKELYDYDYAITEVDKTKLDACHIKFDEPLEDYRNADVLDFNLQIPLKQYSLTGNEKGTSTIYEYSSLMINYANPIDLTPYDGKKITAIGFSAVTRYHDVYAFRELYACLDTSYYSIYVDKEQGIEISRKDTIQSNAVCDGYQYPLHLSPVLERFSQPDDEHHGYTARIRPILYSVGFGNLRGKMNEEWIIGQDAEIQTIDDFKYGVAMKNPVSVPLYPSNISYPSNGLYPIQPEYKETIHPQENRFPSDNMYPMKAGYNYIIFKYRLYYNILNEIIYLDEYYTMSYAYNPKGIFIATNKIERG